MERVRAHTDVLGAIGLALAVVALYSFWGSYMLSSPDAPEQVATTERR